MLKEALEQILKQEAVFIPRGEVSEEYVRLILQSSVVREMAEGWWVECRHRLRTPASEGAIQAAEAALGHHLPEALQDLLKITDGARLYEIPGAWVPDWVREQDPEASLVLYHLFSTSELVAVNRKLFCLFRDVLGDDPDFRHVEQLNYVAFCDAHDGNYLAILLEGPEAGKVFLLHHEYWYRPYGEREVDLYYTVAKSLEEWLWQVTVSEWWVGFEALMKECEPGGSE